MKYLCENIQGVILGYTQSDEITLVLQDYKELTTDAWFGYNVQKMASIAASMATMKFNQVFSDFIDSLYYNGSVYHKAIKNGGAMFDARCFNIPKDEVTNCLLWRQQDATRNSIQMVGQANFSHSELQNKTCNEIQDMLMTQKGINWNDFPTCLKRGTACRKVHKVVNAGGTPMDIWSWELDLDMPILQGENRKYVDNLIYIGE